MNEIGIKDNDARKLTKELNQLLSDYQVFYMNVRGFHWNIKGEKFFELHAKFEELYNDLILKIDEIAERVLTLDGVPVHSYSQYLKMSEIKEEIGVSDGHEAVGSILNSMKILLIKQRNILNISDDASDEGTNALMSDYIREQEKLVWMYKAFLNK
jgi:starvation-inducible DNA-binding protein